MPTTEHLAQAKVLDPSELDLDYELIRPIGEGGMAKVFEVRCRRYRRRLALKVLRADAPDLAQVALRFEREAELLRRLDHPNCVKLIEWGRTRSGGLYILMELAEGQRLTEHLGRPMPVVQVLEIVRQVVLALQHAHRGGIIHRDVKPENVIVLPTAHQLPLVKLLDFGLGKRVSDSRFSPQGTPRQGLPLRQRLLSHGRVFGTPTYMAPELLVGEPASFASDVYAVGVMLFYLLTGRKPFGPDLRDKVRQRAPLLAETAPNTFAPELEQLVTRALRRDPAARGGCAEALTTIDMLQRSPGRGLALPDPGRLLTLQVAGRRLLRRLRSIASSSDHRPALPTAPVTHLKTGT